MFKSKIRSLLYIGAFFFSFYSLFSVQKIDSTTLIQKEFMNPPLEQVQEKFFIGLELRTNNEECSFTMPEHKNRFFSENIYALIPNKANEDILALYTDYEKDHTDAYSWILGCEVSNLDNIPAGLVEKIIPSSKYAVFTTEGKFPEGLIAVWQEIWKLNLPRVYTADFESYPINFDPEHNPEVKVYIAVE